MSEFELGPPIARDHKPQPGRETLTLAAGGWVRVQQPAATVYLRYRMSNGFIATNGFALRDVVMHGDRISVNAFRSLPFAGIESILNGLLMRLVNPWPAGEDYSYLRAFFNDVGPENLSELHDWMHDNALPIGALDYGVAADAEPSLAGHAPLRRPDKITPEFLGNVAAHYQRAVATGRSPGRAIATMADVPIKTAQRWAYLARQQGLLPPVTEKGTSK